MSLLGLKTLLWRKRAPDGLSYGSIDGTKPLVRRSSNLSSSTIIDDGDVDIESQGCSPKPAPRDFRVDARVISDATIGLSDGLTVPFALTAGLSALGNTRVVIFGGLAELMAGAISMGLGGYLGAKSELASYNETLAQATELATRNTPGTEAAIRDVLAPFALPTQTLDAVAAHLARSPRRVDFLMRFRHCAEAPAQSRALTSALTIAVAYFLGGLIPLVPYFCVDDGEDGLSRALCVSAGVMAVALFVFGYAKTGMVVGWHGSYTVRRCLYGGGQMVVVGGLAAGAAMALVKASDALAGGG